MKFEITHRIHFGYMREPGVYEDLTEADARNLSAPRPGLPNGYGRTIPEATVPTAPDVRVNAAPLATEAGGEVQPEAEATATVVEELTVEEPTPTPPAVEEVSLGTRPDDPAERPSDPDPTSFACRDGNCQKPLKSEVARNTHERQKHGRVLG